MTLVNRTAIFHNARYRQHLPILAAAKFYRFGALGKYGHLADGCSFPVTAPLSVILHLWGMGIISQRPPKVTQFAAEWRLKNSRV